MRPLPVLSGVMLMQRGSVCVRFSAHRCCGHSEAAGPFAIEVDVRAACTMTTVLLEAFARQRLSALLSRSHRAVHSEQEA